jgi:hypothetical protein
VNERQEVVDMSVMPDQDASEVLEPGKEPLDFPAMSVPSEWAAVLCRGLDAAVTVGGNQFDTQPSKFAIEGIAVVGAITN